MYSTVTSSTIRERVGFRVRGVTLVELIAVLTLLAIISVAAAVALRDPIRSYMDSKSRAVLTDIADTALRRMARDIRLGLPNSLRVTGAGPFYLELLLTRSGGRYRSQTDASSLGDILDFTVADTSFDTLGAMSALSGQAVAANDILVVYNLFSTPTVATANAYTYNQAASSCTSATPNSQTCNTATISSTGAGALANETKINFASRQFPLASPGNRFHVVSGPVSYVCNANSGVLDTSGNGTGTLTRVSNYTISLTQPTSSFPGSPVTSVLAQDVSDCQITYDPLVLTQSLGLVSIRLVLTHNNETVTLYHEVHVSNLP